MPSRNPMLRESPFFPPLARPPTRLARQFPLCSARLKTWRISERRREFAIITGRIVADASIVISRCANIPERESPRGSRLPLLLIVVVEGYVNCVLTRRRTIDERRRPRRSSPPSKVSRSCAREYARLPLTFPRSPSSSRKFAEFVGERRLFTRSPFAGCCEPPKRISATKIRAKIRGFKVSALDRPSSAGAYAMRRFMLPFPVKLAESGERPRRLTTVTSKLFSPYLSSLLCSISTNVPVTICLRFLSHTSD